MTNVTHITGADEWTVGQASMNLRWLSRAVQTGPNPLDIGTERVLQQEWIVQHIVNHVVQRVSYEWRDIPVVREIDLKEDDDGSSTE